MEELIKVFLMSIVLEYIFDKDKTIDKTKNLNPCKLMLFKDKFA